MSGTILIAEDSRVQMEIMRLNLSRAGFEVVSAYDGQIAIELASQQRFDLIISDQQMPKMTGEEFCRATREGDCNADTPIFLYTAKGSEFDQERLRDELHVTRFFLKPFSPRELVEAVTETLSGVGTAS